MLVAFGVVGLAARREWRLEGSSAEIFSDIYEEQTRGHLEEVSVLFADLQGYTAFSERTPEPEIKAMLVARLFSSWRARLSPSAVRRIPTSSHIT